MIVRYLGAACAAALLLVSAPAVEASPGQLVSPVGADGQTGATTSNPAPVACVSGCSGGGGGGGPVTAASGAFVTGYSPDFTSLLTDIGAPGITVCASDTGSCALNAQMQRLLQAITALSGKVDTLNTNVTSSQVAGSNIVGKFGIDQTTLGVTNGFTEVPATAGGLTTVSLSITNTVTSVKSSAAGQLYYMANGNQNNAAVYVQLFDVATAGAVTLGTTAPKLSIYYGPGASDRSYIAVGIPFANGIQVACTSTRAGSTAPASNCDLNFGIK